MHREENKGWWQRSLDEGSSQSSEHTPSAINLHETFSASHIWTTTCQPYFSYSERLVTEIFNLAA